VVLEHQKNHRLLDVMSNPLSGGSTVIDAKRRDVRTPKGCETIKKFKKIKKNQKFQNFLIFLILLVS
jgi:hypothetical protein